MEDWIGLIPAAGKGLRLGLPYPKELYPVIRNNRYKPVSQFTLDNLVEAGVRHVIFVINETKHQLVAYFGNGQRFGCSISYAVQEPLENVENSTSPGLAHALDSAYHLTHGKTVFFGMADTIIRPKSVFKQAIEQAGPEDDVILGLFPAEHPEKVGMVQRQAERVRRIIDKPQHTGLTEMWGCIIWKPTFTEFLHTAVQNANFDFANIMNQAIDSGLKVRGIAFENSSYLDLGTYQEIIELDRNFRLD